MKSTLSRLILLAAAHCALACPAPAGIAFDTITVSAEAANHEDSLEFVFKFKNTGDSQVTITKIRPACDCLTIAKLPMTYKAGASGELHANMKIGEMEGDVAKAIDIFIDDAAQPAATLTCAAKIPRTYDMAPQVCTWTTGDPLTPKKLSFKVVAKDPVKVLSAKSTKPNFTAEVSEIKAGREYEITITPKSTDSVMLCYVEIATDHPVKKLQVRKVFANIVRKRS